MAPARRLDPAPRNPFAGLSPGEAAQLGASLLADFVARFAERRPTTPVERQRLKVDSVLTDEGVQRVRDYARELRALAQEAGLDPRVVRDPPEASRHREVLDDPSFG